MKRNHKVLWGEKSTTKVYHRIGFWFVNFVIVVVLFTGGFISLVAITTSKETVRQEILEHSHSEAHLAAEFTENYIEVIQGNIRSFASRPSVATYISENNVIEATEKLEQFVQVQTVLDSCGIYNADGIQIAISDSNASTVGQSFADREWFQQAVTSRLPFLSVPIQSRVTGNAITPYAVPIMDEENQLIGVFSGAISLAKLSAVIVKINKAHDTDLSIIDLRNGGLVLANRDPRLVLTPVVDKADILLRLSRGECGGIEVTDREGHQELFGLATMPNLPWGVIIATPSETAFASISTLTQTASIISIVTILITAALSGIFILRITRPIQRLVEETKEIGKGNLDYQIKTTDKGEIGELSRAFSDMTVNLKKTMVSNERLAEEVESRKAAESKLRILNQTLEWRVKERTEKLEIANQELESFSYSVSHDLRAPLRHVHGFVELLNDHLQENTDEKSRHYLEVISNATKDMGQLIDDLLSFSRIGTTQIANKKVDLNTMINEVKTAYSSEMKGRNFNWNVAQLPAIKGDANMIRLVLSNLISNALKFTRLKDPVMIEIGSEPDAEFKDYVIIHIKDNGAGFDMQYKDKLFGVFQRLHSQKDYEGTGIGLANVKRIIQRHGGRVWAHGTPGEGAEFYFTLPKYMEGKS